MKRTSAFHSVYHASWQLDVDKDAFRFENTPQTFSRLISKALQSVKECSTAFIDNIIIFSDSCSQNLNDLESVFEMLVACKPSHQSIESAASSIDCPILGTSCQCSWD